jgi:hypothetical protein
LGFFFKYDCVRERERPAIRRLATQCHLEG